MMTPLVLLMTFLSLSFAESLSLVDEASHIKFPEPYYARNDGHLVGHLEPLGRQIPPLGQVPEYFEIPSPRELWEKNVKTYRPAILRGALLGSPAMEKWDDEYLTREYGADEVYIEHKAENRNLAKKRMSIEAFLLGYKKYNWYVVSVLPDSMRKDVRLPKPLVCSTFLENIQELGLWIGSNGTRSILHRDADNIMHCVVHGRKDWILIHPDYEKDVDMVPSASNQNSGYSHLPVDAIDETINPEVWDVPWEYATLRAGDCLYLPPLYLHQVRSYNRSISATYLYFPRNHFLDDDCKNVDLEKYVSLDEIEVDWTYMTGQDTIDMGYPNPSDVKQSFLYRMDITGMKWVNSKYYLYISAEHRENFLQSDRKGEFFKIFDANKDGIITRKEFADASFYIWKEWSRIGYPADKKDDNEDAELNNGTSNFAPNLPEHDKEEDIARRFLEFLIRVKGVDGSISFDTFKEWVVVNGDIAKDFNYIDLDLDGFITTTELQEVNLKRLRQFSRMFYTLRGTRIQGGGRYKEQVEGEDWKILIGLDHIPDELMETESEEEDEYEEFMYYFRSVKALVEKQPDQKLTFAPFQEFQQEFDAANSEEGEAKNDYKFMFHVLDRGQKGYVSTEDVNKYIENLPLPPAPFPANADIAIVKKEKNFDRDSIITVWNSYMTGMKKANEMKNALDQRRKYQAKKKAENANDVKEIPTGEIFTKKEEL